MTDRSTLERQISQAIGDHDRRRAIDVALTAVDDGSVSVEELYLLVAKILVDIGAAWQEGNKEVWQEHFASGVVRTIVESCALRVEQAAPAHRTATAVLTAPSEEYHDLGLRMLADRFTLAGWRAHFLGANLPTTELIAAVHSLNADAVVLSASTHFHRLSLRECVGLVSAAHPKIRIWVSGSAFALEHDGWLNDMIVDPLAIPHPGGE